MLFGAVGCGKSSVINLLANKPIAQVFTNIEACTKEPRRYLVPIGKRQFTLWDTTGFGLPRRGAINPLLPYEQACDLLRNRLNGVHLILLCASKDDIRSNNHRLRSLYWLIKDFFFGGYAPVALVVTHFDTPDDSKKWWEDNQRAIFTKTDIPVASIPHARTSTKAQNGSDESGRALRSLLEQCATFATPISPRTDLPSDGEADLLRKCGLTDSDATELVHKLCRPQNQPNSAINAERPVAMVSSNIEPGPGRVERGGRGPSAYH